MKTHSEGLDRRLDTYAEVARRRGKRAAAAVDGPSHWKRFAAATGATLAGVAAADGAIVHVMPPTAHRVEIPLFGSDFSSDLDLNQDGENDLVIGANSFLKPYLGYQYVVGAYGLSEGAELFGTAGGHIRRFAADAEIAAVQPSASGSVARYSVTSYYQYAYGGGYWAINDTGFAGFVLGSGQSRRSGWIQFRTESFRNFAGLDRIKALEVVQWAYESIPGMSIKAGQTTSVSVPGDYDGNGTVGPEDYTKWKTTFGDAVTAGTGADGNQNGIVDAADYAVWRNINDSGSGALLSEAAVPEPATVTLGVLALGAAGVTALRRWAKS